ncbi:hypothetical protein [Aquabacterium sp.]|uniref:hypothetical protein n=1 Tax=Aquabacterium sp. TaxID=1872578 RepID=UPI0025B80805|nr:hypothetical protein [Aquabacterium sp.]
MEQYVENNSNAPMYVGNTMIPPGEGKLVDVPMRATAPAAAEPRGPNLVERMATFLDRPVKDIVPDLPELTHEALQLAESQEAAGQNRKTLITALQAECITRADEKLQAQQQEQAAQALLDAREALLVARLALANLPESATHEERAAALAVVDEAQAKVDALAPADEA